MVKDANRGPRPWGLAVGLVVVLATGVAGGSLDQAFQAATTYQPGQSPQPLEQIRQAVQEAANDTGRQAVLEQSLMALLQSPQATPAARQFACKQLAVVGSSRCVPVLEKMLYQADLVDMACYALRSNASPQAGQALRHAARQMPDRLKPTIIHVLAQRAEPASIPVLIELAGSPQQPVSLAAMAALGRYADPRAEAVLVEAMKSDSPPVRQAAARALLSCADRWAAGGQVERAAQLARRVFDHAGLPMVLKRAALLSVMRNGKDRAMSLAMSVLENGPEELQSTVAAHAGLLDGAAAIERLLAAMDRLNQDQQAVLVDALVARHGQAMTDWLKKLVEHPHLEVRLAALRGLGQVGGADTAGLLIAALKKSEPEKKEAVKALTRLPAGSLEKHLAGRLDRLDPSVQQALVHVLAGRKDLTDLERLVHSTHEEVAIEALRVFGLLAEPAHLAMLYEGELGKAGEARRRAVERAIVTIARHHQAEDSAVRTAVSRLEQCDDPAMRCSLLRILGALPNAQSLAALTTALKDADPACRETALRLLVRWPDAQALDVLVGVIEQTDRPAHRLLALRGLADLASRPGLPVDRQLHYLRFGLERADQPALLKSMLGALGKVASPQALPLVLRYLADPAVATEAGVAACGIARATVSAQPRALVAAMELVAEKAPSPAVGKQARELLTQAEQKMLDTLGCKPAGPWQPLFNGRDLTGWKHTGHGRFFVENGCLVGTQTDGQGGDLWTESRWGDFELRITYRVHWPANSGIWFRWDGRKGYQFDILQYKKPVAFSGSLYCPGKLFILRNTDPSLEDRQGWNEARVLAVGPNLVQWLNGVLIGTARDDQLTEGPVGIQVHPGQNFKGMRIVIKRLEIRPLVAR